VAFFFMVVPDDRDGSRNCPRERPNRHARPRGCPSSAVNAGPDCAPPQTHLGRPLEGLEWDGIGANRDFKDVRRMHRSRPDPCLACLETLAFDRQRGSATGLAIRRGLRSLVALRVRRNGASRGDIGFKNASRAWVFHRPPCDCT